LNYFVHAIRYLDQPYFCAGVAVPDWLSVVDRKSRVRRKGIEKHQSKLTGDDLEIAMGALQHLDDDRWFHNTAGFYLVTAKLAEAFREILPEQGSWKCGFLGHIVMELLLDAVFIADHPQLLDDYYQVMEQLDADRVERVISQLATHPPQHLASLIKRFCKERFLADYVDDERLLFRLNQVMKRVKLTQLPPETVDVLAYGRTVVRENRHNLLPSHLFVDAIEIMPRA